ncbi:hypothetical protein U1Q18_033226, partial [Sarracenia purpurea var. burkii]
IGPSNPRSISDLAVTGQMCGSLTSRILDLPRIPALSRARRTRTPSKEVTQGVAQGFTPWQVVGNGASWSVSWSRIAGGEDMVGLEVCRGSCRDRRQ